MQEPLVDIGATDTLKVPIERVLDGQLFIVRQAFQQLGLFDLLEQKSLEGVRQSAGPAVADFVTEHGFERIHEVLSPEQLPQVTDVVYERVAEAAQEVLCRYVPRFFDHDTPFYYERSPNVRFHYPFDLTRAYRKQFDEFARNHGQGKIAAHGPHRDYWLDCPDNAVNHWIAMGRVREGNGLSIFHEHYDQEFEFGEDGNLRPGSPPLKAPLNFDMEPGDTLVFHANHLHASELNRTDETRFVISFRMSFGKPHFPEGHHHEYLHSGLAAGGKLKRSFAAVPAYLQASYAADRARRAKKKLTGSRAAPPVPVEPADTKLASKGEVSVPLEDLPVGSVRAIASDACLARLAEDRFMVCSRRCPHAGADLSHGFLRDEQLVCPWHNLHFDPDTGASPCKELPSLQLLAVEIEVEDGQVVVRPAAKEDRESD